MLLPSHGVEISCYAYMSLLANFAGGADPDEKLRRSRTGAKVSLAAALSAQLKLSVTNNILHESTGPGSLRREA
jgi:hypothetical protein